MSKELVISSNRHETKVAILEDDVLVELYFQRANEYSLAGSIHKGRVTRVLPGMQSAFVDLGLERDTFLYVSDFFDEHSEDLDKVADEKPARRVIEVPSAVVSPVVTRERESREREVREARVEREPRVQKEKEKVEREESEAPAIVTEGSATAEGTGPREPRDSRGRAEADRRGKRGRRRRGRRGGLPESKYASEVNEASPERLEEPEEEGEEIVEAPAVSEAEVFVLPGESLAKYRNRPAAAPVAEPTKETSKTFSATSSADIEDFAPAVVDMEEDAISDAEVEEADAAQPVSASVAEVVEPVAIEDLQEELDDIETIDVEEIETIEIVPADSEEAAEDEADEPPAVEASESEEPEEDTTPEIALGAGAGSAGAVLDFSELASSTEEDEEEEVEAIEEAREELLTETEEDDDELDAAQDAAEELLAEEAGLLPEESGETAVIGEDGPEPARQPHSLTAALRERDRGSRFQARGRRGRRRRGRSGEEKGATAPESVAPAPVVIPVVAPPPEPVSDAAAPAARGHRERSPLPSITDLLKPGQEILVQIAKEPIGQKGARITSHIALPGRYCVYMPTVDHNGVSRKIASDEERLRLKRILQQHRQGMPGGFIIRTAGEGHSEEEIANDMQFLYNLWLDIRSKSEKRAAPCLVHHDLDIVQRTLRDHVTSDYKTIWLDNEELYESTLQFVQRFQPNLVHRVKLWTRQVSIFDAFNITSEMEKALRPKVWLKSGGYIVINQTEALVAIDINTGKFVGKSNKLEDTIVKTNTEAVKEIVRQIRLRDLGGIIVVDFIDMDERKNRQKVMQVLEEAMRQDRAPYKILQFNDFGLVAITRKRVKQSLERTLCMPCPYCEGAGTVKSVPTVIGEILAEAQKLAKAIDDKNVVLRVHPEVAKVMKSHRNQYLEELEATFGRPVLVTGDASVHIEKFDLA